MKRNYLRLEFEIGLPISFLTVITGMVTLPLFWYLLTQNELLHITLKEDRHQQINFHCLEKCIGCKYSPWYHNDQTGYWKSRSTIQKWSLCFFDSLYLGYIKNLPVFKKAVIGSLISENFKKTKKGKTLGNFAVNQDRLLDLFHCQFNKSNLKLSTHREL